MNSPEIFTNLLELFFSNPNAKFYLREIQRLINKPVGSLQRYLMQLEKEKIVLTKKEGMMKYFYINPDYPYFTEIQSIVLRELRRKKLEKNLKKVISKIKNHYKPNKIILFGSLASGRVSPESDIDILIVKENISKRYWDRVKEIAPLFADCDVGVDYIIWTSSELLEETRKNIFLREEIVKKGKIIYERAA
jgi:predicted nucleotidyltransferase